MLTSYMRTYQPEVEGLPEGSTGTSDMEQPNSKSGEGEVRFDRIVLPLDGSPLAESALPWAEVVARVARSEVDIVTAVTRIATPSEEALDHEASRSLQWASAELESRGIEYRRIILTGDPASAIVNLANKRGAGMIVMATHGRSGIGRRLLGSVTDRVLNSSDAPVLVVRGDSTSAVMSVNRPEFLLVPLDGSETAQAVIPVTAALGRLFGSRVVLFHSIDSQKGSGDAEREEIQRHIEQVREQLSAEEISAEVIVVDGDAKSTIPGQLRDLPGSMAVMASTGATGIGRSQRGSVTDHVIHHSVAPVLVVPPRSFLGSVIE